SAAVQPPAAAPADRAARADERPFSARQETAAAAPFAAAWPDGARTEVGGVLFLINLMQHLALPGCFEPGWQLASRVGAWGVLETLGRALLPAVDEADPLWPALAALAGRPPGTLPEPVSRIPYSVFRIPYSVSRIPYSVSRKPYSVSRWRPSQTAPGASRLTYHAPRITNNEIWITNNGLRITEYGLRTTNNGLRITDNGLRITNNISPILPPTWLAIGGAAWQASGVAWPDAAAVPDACRRQLHPYLVDWLALALPFIRWRLTQALRPAAAAAPPDLAQLLLRPGRLFVTRSHVDLVLRLDDVSLPLRLAGLDWNPGWLPEFGRVVTFHYE
ncbi:MAG: hypothetical protein KC425_01720, partial [Anaerolineales bacterium]|nr:hypothetical protein [Anaerolineales bacterium]